MGTKIDKKIRVEAKWLYNWQPSQAYEQLIRLLLRPTGDEIAQTNGDKDGSDKR